MSRTEPSPAPHEPEGTGFHLGYRPGLDGLRGVAILMVLLLHLGIVGEGFGFVGVDIFFVLSGFLITCLLIEEWQKTGRIRLGSFYCRRALRLLPALAAMLVAFVAYSFMVHPHGRAVRELHESIRALCYFTNWSLAFHIGHREFLNHTWSLSIEEQFYLLWPLTLLLFLRRSTAASMFHWFVLLALLAWLTRVALFLGGTETIAGNVFEVNPARISAGLDTRADALLLGCAAAVAFSCRLPSRLALSPSWRRLLSALAMVGLIAFCFVPPYNAWNCCIGWFLVSLFALPLIASINRDDPWLNPLQCRPLVYLGKISYGLYLWHYPIFLACQEHFWNHWRWFAVPITLSVVLASYYLLELPCLMLKGRLQPLNQLGAPK